MKKEKSEELYVKWVDGLLSPEEESQLATLMEESPELEAELSESRMVAEAVREGVSNSVEPPYGDFFNSQLMRKVDLEIASKTPAKRAERWWESLRWAWAPAGALALVLAFFAGHRIGKPIATDAGVAAVGPSAPAAMADVPSVYFTSDQLNADVISGADGEVSAIVVTGLDDLKDDLDLSTASLGSDLKGLPVNYVRAKARNFQ
ncbi:hypothetical protein V2O64_23080 [Verrucomicrobiaceae bacterium 227]